MDEHENAHVLNVEHGFSQSSRSSFVSEHEEPEIEPEFQDIYNTFSKYIRTKTKVSSILSSYNFQLNRLTQNDLVYHFKQLFRDQKVAFKVNISLGYILKNKKTGEFRFFWSSQNNQLLFDVPCLVRNSSDKQKLTEHLESLPLIEKVQRPNSEWVFVKVTNAHFFLYKLKGIPIGSGIDIPVHLLKNKGLIALVRNLNSGKPYMDQKCFFRCLALHQGAAVKSLERKTNKLLSYFCEKASIKSFRGVTLDQLEDISRIFNVAINVYKQNERRETELIFRSTLRDNPLNLNLCLDHFSYIQNMAVYSKSYRCSKCDKFWTSSGNFHRHFRSCEAGVREKYGSGTFSVKSSIFEELDSVGICIPPEKRYFPYRATYDIECFLKRPSKPDSDKTTYSAEHELVSVSVCSNVPGYTNPKCFVLKKDGDQPTLVKEFLDYLVCISESSALLLREYYVEYLDQISESSLNNKFQTYINQMPVLSFNGAKYDLKILKQYLIPLLVKMDTIKSVIKKGTGYMVIATEELKFLDIVFYVAPGFNYDKFLRAYEAKQTKSYFPYEYLDSIEKLDSTDFPLYEAFFSKLKEHNTLEPGSKNDLSVEELRLIGYDSQSHTPITSSEQFIIGQYRYEKLKSTFVKNKWTIRDYLKHYNNLDVQPFLVALENMTQYYKDRGVDVFKEAVSGKYHM